MEGNQVGSSSPPTNANTTSTYDTGSLGHRLIGVGIVIGLVIVALLLWIRFAKWPRRKLRSLGCTCLPEPRSSKDIVVGVADEESGLGPRGLEVSQRSMRGGSSRVAIQIPSEYARSPEHHATFHNAEVGNRYSKGSTYITQWERSHPDVVPPPKSSSKYYTTAKC
ncbi:hypothetical protein Moror_15259 [Moniliophthora roreri MCA 2997]|uniref:Uncharacterized protein n=1 Tax=Moniliophthora roreri (strain MCA 2997) TaxID=1381753 RepID=V2X241_MONRO|nr:hypothetical protein Moror_15259 [Moniliophthora roreri MCA 2997]KAI3622571.1 hypothetical protein WG66_015381 [Moniliophthora roreri]